MGSKAEVIDELKTKEEYVGSQIHLYVESENILTEHNCKINELSDENINQLHRSWIYSNIIPATVNVEIFRYNIFSFKLFLTYF